MIRKATFVWIAALSLIIAALLFTNHAGLAIRFANYLFYVLVLLVALSIFKYED